MACVVSEAPGQSRLRYGRAMTPPLHRDIAHLSALLGTWRGAGAGEYPTIDSFTYVEEVTIGQVGKPFLSYSQKTRHGETDLPLHAEAGYFRPVGLERLELVVAQPSGIVEVDEGSVVVGAAGPEGAGLVIELASVAVTTTRSAKAISAVRRRVSVVGDLMTYEVDMAAVGQPIQHHLRAELRRQPT